MIDSDIPTKFQVPFASGAPGGNTRAVPVTTVDPNAASETLGFPTPTLTPIAGGGVPPDGRDFNGLFNQITAWTRWYQAGGPITYDATFQGLVGGYPKNARVMSALYPATEYISTVDNNVTNPDTGGAGWSYYGWAPGCGRLTLSNTQSYGFLFCTDGTIGNAASNATDLADPTAWPLFNVIWNSTTNVWAPLFTSAGAPVARGANAAADFAANRRLSLTRQLGRALIIAGSGVGLTPRLIGQFLGEETHSLSSDENGTHFHGAGILDPTHVHGYTDPTHVHGYLTTTTFSVENSAGGTPFSAMTHDGYGAHNTDAAGVGITIAAAATGVRVNSPNGLDTTYNSGGGDPHNNMQPSTAWNIEVKL